MHTVAANRKETSIKNYSVEEVQKLLAELKLPQYQAAFAAENFVIKL